jgi:hypothetical protein
MDGKGVRLRRFGKPFPHVLLDFPTLDDCLFFAFLFAFMMDN